MPSREQIARMDSVLEDAPLVGRINLSRRAGVSRSMAQRYLNRFKKGKKSQPTDTNNGEENIKDSMRQNEDSCDIVANNKNRPYTLAEIAELFSIDTKIWEPKNVITNHWDVTTREGVVYKNYQTKVSWRLGELKVRMEFVKKVFGEELKGISKYKHKPIKKYIVNKKNKMLEINIRDLHLGKLCWHAETGEDFDSKIAADRFHSAIDDLLNKAAVFGYEKILMAASDDFFNADDVHGNTTAGTYQCTDVRWQKMFRLGRELMCQAIDKLREYSPVHIIVTTGNHDTQRSFFLGEVLDAVYNNCSNVNIDNSPLGRKYYRYGNVLLGFTHGSNIKQADLPIIMATEASEDWGQVKYREFHVAHLHKSKQIKYIDVDENHGFVVRQMRSLTGTDSWHYNKGFIGAIKGAEAFIWDYETGLVAQFESHINVK